MLKTFYGAFNEGKYGQVPQWRVVVKEVRVFYVTRLFYIYTVNHTDKRKDQGRCFSRNSF